MSLLSVQKMLVLINRTGKTWDFQKKTKKKQENS